MKKRPCPGRFFDLGCAALGCTMSIAADFHDFNNAPLQRVPVVVENGSFWQRP
jgi:hypothetical protein